MQAFQHARVAQQPLKRPSQPGRGGLVPSQQEGDELVAQLLVAERFAVLVAGLDQQRQNVIPPLGVVAVGGDLVEQQLVDLGSDAHRLVAGAEWRL